MNKPFAFLLVLFVLFTSAGAQELQRRSVVGLITTITVDDLSKTLGISQNESRYKIRVQMEGVEHIVLGFGEPRKELTEMDKAKLALLMEAMQRQYTVALRLDSVVKSEIIPTHARIIAVSVKP